MNTFIYKTNCFNQIKSGQRIVVAKDNRTHKLGVYKAGANNPSKYKDEVLYGFKVKNLKTH